MVPDLSEESTARTCLVLLLQGKFVLVALVAVIVFRVLHPWWLVAPLLVVELIIGNRKVLGWWRPAAGPAVGRTASVE